MTKRGQVKPGGLVLQQARAGMVVAVLFLLFGLGFGVVVFQDTPPSEGGLRFLLGAFMLLWIIVCLAMIFTSRRMLSAAGKAGDNTLLDIAIDETQKDSVSTTGGDFAARLRQLEGLKRDGLISAEEYKAKRAQVMEEKW